MNCSKCNAPGVIQEAQGNGQTKCTCKKCGMVEVKDSRGKGLLTETTPLRGPLMG